jgi:hypothetical protein
VPVVGGATFCVVGIVEINGRVVTVSAVGMRTITVSGELDVGEVAKLVVTVAVGERGLVAVVVVEFPIAAPENGCAAAVFTAFGGDEGVPPLATSPMTEPRREHRRQPTATLGDVAHAR